MPISLSEVLGVLAGCSESPPASIGDEHERWALYLNAAGRRECHVHLFDAVGLEPDPNVALAIVLQVLADLSPSARSDWISQLQSERGREFASRRAGEIGIYQSRPVARLLGDDAEQSWSNWLQLLLSEFSDEVVVLQRLASRGRTKRIRNTAVRRLPSVEAAARTDS